MSPDERNIPEGSNRRHRGRFDLFYFEQVGPRSYLRFTRLALFLILCLIIVPMAALLALFAWNRRDRPKDVDVNITVPTPKPHDYSKPIIQPTTPAPAPPRVIQQHIPAATPPRMPSAPPVDDDRLSTPSPTPSPTPVRTPT
jgi:hypothetical protein